MLPLHATAPRSLLQDFFKPKHIIIRLRDEEKWGPAQRDALYKVSALLRRNTLSAGGICCPVTHVPTPAGLQ